MHASMPAALLSSCGVRLLQTAEPAILCAACVWDVAFLRNGDLATACADHVARLWTTSAERHASEETVATYYAAIEAQKQAAAGNSHLLV